ncbi:ABC transporter ATP-binding protein [Kiritimatiellota bacterium B12222]|nr:ABC transporter ATP-binding protein [Kiritimatiellota bacterium B12222]
MKKQLQTPVTPPAIGPGPGHGRRGPGAQWAGPKEKPKDSWGTFKKLWGYLASQKKGLVLVILIVMITTALNIIGPWLLKYAIDTYLTGHIHIPGLAKVLLAMGAIHLAAAGFTFIQQWIMIAVSQRAIQNLRRDIFHKFQILTIRFFDNRNSGELMSRVTNDIDNISNVISSGFLDLISAALSIVAVVGVMFALNWQLALICLAVIPLIIVMTKQIAKHTRMGFSERQKYLGNLNGIIEESISGQRVIKAFAKEQEQLETFSVQNRLMQKASNKANIMAGLMGPLMNLMNNLNYAVTALAGGILAVNGLVSVGTIAAFLSYTKQFSRPLNQMAQLYTSIQSALAGAERVFAILDETPEFDDAPEALPLGRVTGDLVIKDLHFRYLPDIPIIKGITIHAKPGQTIALVGPTGAGKTTIINLLTRFYDYHQGSITLDGKDIRQLKKTDLRQRIGIVLQETFLFSDTVKENIRYGRLNATDDEIIDAAKLANAHQFIHRMPQGYDTEVSENGATLSQGQKQLIAIARAILSAPSILILDEATSSVDTRTEIQIQEGMLKLMEGRTCFVIAHRLSTIKNADYILVMDEGRIREQGTHRELMNARGFYHNLYHSQFGKNAISIIGQDALSATGSGLPAR